MRICRMKLKRLVKLVLLVFVISTAYVYYSYYINPSSDSDTEGSGRYNFLKQVQEKLQFMPQSLNSLNEPPHSEEDNEETEDRGERKNEGFLGNKLFPNGIQALWNRVNKGSEGDQADPGNDLSARLAKQQQVIMKQQELLEQLKKQAPGEGLRAGPLQPAPQAHLKDTLNRGDDDDHDDGKNEEEEDDGEEGGKVNDEVWKGEREKEDFWKDEQHEQEEGEQEKEDTWKVREKRPDSVGQAWDARRDGGQPAARGVDNGLQRDSSGGGGGGGGGGGAMKLAVNGIQPRFEAKDMKPFNPQPQLQPQHKPTQQVRADALSLFQRARERGLPSHLKPPPAGEPGSMGRFAGQENQVADSQRQFRPESHQGAERLFHESVYNQLQGRAPAAMAARSGKGHLLQESVQRHDPPQPQQQARPRVGVGANNYGAAARAAGGFWGAGQQANAAQMSHDSVQNNHQRGFQQGFGNNPQQGFFQQGVGNFPQQGFQRGFGNNPQQGFQQGFGNNPQGFQQGFDNNLQQGFRQGVRNDQFGRQDSNPFLNFQGRPGDQQFGNHQVIGRNIAGFDDTSPTRGEPVSNNPALGAGQQKNVAFSDDEEYLQEQSDRAEDRQKNNEFDGIYDGDRNDLGGADNNNNNNNNVPGSSQQQLAEQIRRIQDAFANPHLQGPESQKNDSSGSALNYQQIRESFGGVNPFLPEVKNLNVAVNTSVKCVPLKTSFISSHVCVYPQNVDTRTSKEIITTGTFHEENELKEFEAALATNTSLGAVDIGAGLGIYSLVAAARGHKVLAVEPMKLHHPPFTATMQINGLTNNVTLVADALGEKIGLGRVRTPHPRGNMGAVYVHPVESLELAQGEMSGQDLSNLVRILRLDHLLPVTPFSSAVMKLDAQGDEELVLRGADQFFQKVDVHFVLMHWLPAFNREHLRECHQFLTTRGYLPYPSVSSAKPFTEEEMEKDINFIVWKKMPQSQLPSQDLVM